MLLYRSAPVAKKKETTSIFSSKSAFSEKSNDSGEYKLSVSLQAADYRYMLTGSSFCCCVKRFQLNRAVFEWKNTLNNLSVCVLFVKAGGNELWDKKWWQCKNLTITFKKHIYNHLYHLFCNSLFYMEHESVRNSLICICFVAGVYM